MRNQYIDAALDRLTDLVDTGLTLPTAHESVVTEFELTAHESHVLLSRYDTMLHNLGNGITLRSRALPGPSAHSTAGI
jgi:hypothetical protein